MAHEQTPPTTPKAPRSRYWLLAAVIALATIAAPALSTVEASAATVRYSYSGYAFGTTVSVNNTVTSGYSAPVSLGCTTDGTIRRSNNTAAIDLAPVGTTGTVATAADTSASPVRARTSATTQRVNLLDGLVTATAVQAVSSTTRTGSTFAVSASGTTFTDLVVAGVRIDSTPQPNTTIDLVGFGYLIVNEQVRPAANRLNVNALRLVINTSNVLGVTVGTSAVVSGAVSQLSDPVSGLVGGEAYGTRAQIGTTFDSGPSFVKYMPCLGTGNMTQTNTGANVNIPGIATTGTVSNSVRASVSTSAISAVTYSTVQNVNVLNGVVRAGLVKAVARGDYNGKAYTFSDISSTFGSLTIRGTSVGANVKPGTVVTVAGVGKVTLRKVTRSARAISVVMIEVVLTQRVNSLPAGTVIRIGAARVAIG